MFHVSGEVVLCADLIDADDLSFLLGWSQEEITSPHCPRLSQGRVPDQYVVSRPVSGTTTLTEASVALTDFYFRFVLLTVEKGYEVRLLFLLLNLLEVLDEFGNF